MIFRLREDRKYVKWFIDLHILRRYVKYSSNYKHSTQSDIGMQSLLRLSPKKNTLIVFLISIEHFD
jgi:hypothetical protein